MKEKELAERFAGESEFFEHPLDYLNFDSDGHIWIRSLAEIAEYGSDTGGPVRKPRPREEGETAEDYDEYLSFASEEARGQQMGETLAQLQQCVQIHHPTLQIKPGTDFRWIEVSFEVGGFILVRSRDQFLPIYDHGPEFRYNNQLADPADVLRFLVGSYAFLGAIDVLFDNGNVLPAHPQHQSLSDIAEVCEQRWRSQFDLASPQPPKGLLKPESPGFLGIRTSREVQLPDEAVGVDIRHLTVKCFSYDGTPCYGGSTDTNLIWFLLGKNKGHVVADMGEELYKQVRKNVWKHLLSFSFLFKQKTSPLAQ